MSPKIKSLFERLIENSKWNGDCLECTYKARSLSGYALMKYRRSTKGAHRISWEAHNGKIPDGLLVLHKCDNPLCINPDHLFLGTFKDNTNDMIQKKRNNFWGRKKYDDELVEKAIFMRKKGLTYKEISKLLDLPLPTINSFFRRNSSKEKVSEFYAKPKYDKNFRDKCKELKKQGILCKNIQKIMNVPKRTLSYLLKD